MSDDTLNIEIDGKPCTARQGQMIIEVTDAQDVYVPRFCYHRKLSIAANCRMCLVEVENIPKPLPACATPVADGMKVRTRSALAVAAQKATMEFLLINHPLDCPICDQGGECELQDLAMGYGQDVSRYNEGKRVVRDKNLGPLVSTDMTRCIHCTRCVRFGQEIAGIQELGTIGRGERTEIGTFVERSVDHELSGNIIDLCPVGALNSKPFRYRARSWEMTQLETIAPHDCVGSNLYAHVRRGRLMRVVPRPNDEVNETWISDRDRFSYEGIYSGDRLLKPMVRDGDEWRETDWSTALEAATRGLQQAVAQSGPQGIGVLTSPSATVEEHYLAAGIARGLGSGNVDHRLMRTDFSDQARDPVLPGLGMSLDEFSNCDAVLMVGCDLRKEAPILAHRLKQVAAAGGQVGCLDIEHRDLLFPVMAQAVHPPASLSEGLEMLLDATRSTSTEVGADDQHSRLAGMLAAGSQTAIVLGLAAASHPAFGRLRTLAGRLARATGSTLGYVTHGANSAGAAIVGALPHRRAGGGACEDDGLNAMQMLRRPLAAYLLHGFEPEWDAAAGEAALATLNQAGFVTVMTPYVTDAMLGYGHVLLPTGTFAETGGTFVNVEGRWQSFTGVASPVGESRPAWKILRVLAGMLGLEGMEYDDISELGEAIKSAAGRPSAEDEFDWRDSAASDSTHDTAVPLATIYGCDPIVRRAAALQATEEASHGWRREVSA
ncbi:MAG: NADH-quinone oxidoreductase subunit G [Gammaproteobacteria bacterium]|nr:MAG: NADH-quinone oxidoreductase subunit G [Gammaproteobacteria bacterium]